MDRFLKEAKCFVDSQENSVHVVLGNEACDLDSAVSAVVYAFYHSKVKNTPGVHIPVLNIPSREYRLRNEVSHAFQKLGISDDELTFRDQINLSRLCQDGLLTLTLVDHNVLPLEDAALETCVTEVVDHRMQERPASNSVDLVIEPVGSCCTLIAEKLLSGSDSTLVPQEVWQLLHATVLLDTVNLSETAGRAKQKDREIIQQLEAILDGKIDRKSVFDEVQSAKFDVSALTTLELLRKDLKIAKSANQNIAVSSIPIHMHDLLSRDNLHDDLLMFSEQQDAAAVVVMALHVDEMGEPSRQLAIYSLDTELQSQVLEMLQPQLELSSPASSPLLSDVFILRNVHNSDVSCGDVLQLIKSQFVDDLPNKTTTNAELMVDEELGSSNADAASCLEPGITHDLIGIDLSSPGVTLEEDAKLQTETTLIDTTVEVSQSSSTQDLLGLGLDFKQPGGDAISNNNNIIDLFVDHTNVMLEASPIATPDRMTPDLSLSPAQIRSYPATPPNSHMEPSNFPSTQPNGPYLPSFNSFEMVKKIESKKALLTESLEDTDAAEAEAAEKPCPFTPQNSFSDASMLQSDRDLPSWNNVDVVKAVKKKRASQSGLDGIDVDVKQEETDEADRFPFNPSNSESGDEDSVQKSDLQNIPENSDMVEIIENKRTSLGSLPTNTGHDNEESSALHQPNPTSDSTVEMTESRTGQSSDVPHTSDASEAAQVELTEIDFAHRIANEIIHNALESCAINPELLIPSEPSLDHQALEALAELEEVINSADELDKSDCEEDIYVDDDTNQRNDNSAPDETLGTQMYVETDYLAGLDPFRGALEIVPPITDIKESSQREAFKTKPDDDEEMMSPDSAIDVTSPSISKNRPVDSPEVSPSEQTKEPSLAVDADDGVQNLCVDHTDPTEQKLQETAQHIVAASVESALGVIQQQNETNDKSPSENQTSNQEEDGIIRTSSSDPLEVESHAHNVPDKDTVPAKDDTTFVKSAITDTNSAECSTHSESVDTKPMLRNVSPRDKEEVTRTVVLHCAEEDNFPEEVITPESAHVKRQQHESRHEDDHQKNSNWKQTLGLEWDSDDDDDDDDDGGRGVSSSTDIINISLEDQEPSAVRPNSLNPLAPKKKIVPNIDLLRDDDEDEMDVALSSCSSVAGDESGIPSLDDVKTPDDVTTPEAMGNPVLKGQISWENSSPSSPVEPIPEYTAKEEFEENRHWRSVDVGSKTFRIDMKVIEPYKKVLSHGGYYGDGFNALIVFAACYLPDKGRKDYQYVMDNLFLYVISTLELLVVEDYMIIYFHGSTPKNKMPGLRWLKRCYDMIDRRLRKNLKGLLIVHPTLWLKTVIVMTKPFISKKFSSKIHYVRSLHDLTSMVPTEYIYIPDEIKAFDRRRFRSSVSSSNASTPS